MSQRSIDNGRVKMLGDHTPLPAIPTSLMYREQKRKAEQWDKLCENIVYDAMNQRYIINEIICDLHRIQLRDDRPKGKISKTPSGWPTATLKDHDRVALQNALRDVAIKYHATQQLRSRIGTLLEQYIKGRD